MKIKNKTGKSRKLSGKNIAMAIVLAACTFSFSDAMAQAMLVQENGAVTAYELDEIRSLSFLSGNLTITNTDNSTGVYALTTIDNLSFGVIQSVENINSNNPQNLLAYPNPAGDLLNISVLGESNINGEVQILNLSGKVVKSGLIEGENVLTFDVSELSKGMYVCRYINVSESKTVKFIKK